jgi:hypothetical protein
MDKNLACIPGTQSSLHAREQTNFLNLLRICGRLCPVSGLTVHACAVQQIGKQRPPQQV